MEGERILPSQAGGFYRWGQESLPIQVGVFTFAGGTVSKGTAEAGGCGSVFGLSPPMFPSCGLWPVDARQIFVMRSRVVDVVIVLFGCF